MVLVCVVILTSIYEASAKVSSLVEVEKSKVTVSKRTNHERFELVHRNRSASFLRHNKVKHVLKIEHVPNFHDSILGSAANQVVLIEGVVLVLLFRGLEFIGRNVLKIDCTKFVEWFVA